MSYILWAALALLGISMLIVLIRLEKGPSILDRTVVIDVISVIFMQVIGIAAVLEFRSEVLPIFVILSVVGCISATTVARFVARDKPEDKRILTREEAEARKKLMESEEARWLRVESQGHGPKANKMKAGDPAAKETKPIKRSAGAVKEQSPVTEGNSK